MVAWMAELSLGAESIHMGRRIIIILATIMVMLTTASDAEVPAQSSLCLSLHKH